MRRPWARRAEAVAGLTVITAVLLWLGLLLLLALSALIGLAMFVLLARSLRQSGYDDGVAAGRRLEANAGTWRPVISDGWNTAETPRRRRRSPDHQLVTRTMPPPLDRPVFYDH